MSKSRLFCAVILMISTHVLGQNEDWENDGEIEDVKIEIVKDREIKLPKASRNFEKIPPMSFETQVPELQYFFSNLDLPLPSLNVRVRPLRIKDQPLQKLYGNYVKAGFGNYTTPYFEGYFSSKRKRDHMYGAHINFLNSQSGPVDGENSGSGMLDTEVFGKYFGNSVTVSGDVGLKRRSFNFYGYPQGETVNEDSLDHIFTNFYFKTTFENTNKKAKIQYKTGLQFDYLSDNLSAEESEVQLDFEGKYELGEKGTINLKTDLDIISPKDTQLDVKTRNVFRVNPTLTFQHEGFLIDAGFNVVYENDTLGDSDELHFYPVARARYMLSSGFEVHAGITGDVEKLTYRKLFEQNPWLKPNIRAFNSYKTFEFFGGIGGKLTSKIGFSTGISVANYQNMAFFINSFEDQSKFEVAYDLGNTAVVNINGQLSYNRNEELRLTLRGDYWGYNTDEIPEAYHRPNYKISALSTFKLFDKLRFEADAYAMGGIVAFDQNTLTNENLDALLDLNFMAEYLVSDQFSAFVRLNNLLSNEYQVFYNYPNRALQVMVGATYSF